MSLGPGSQSPAGSPRAELSILGVVRESLARFISPIALCLGTRVSWLLIPDAGICCQWSLGVRRHIYFTSRTLSGIKSLFAFTPEASNSRQMALASPSPTLFHQSHFEWNLKHFSVSDVGRRRPTRKPACRYWALFLRPLYSSFADHILVRGTVADSGCD